MKLFRTKRTIPLGLCLLASCSGQEVIWLLPEDDSAGDDNTQSQTDTQPLRGSAPRSGGWPTVSPRSFHSAAPDAGSGEPDSETPNPFANLRLPSSPLVDSARLSDDLDLARPLSEEQLALQAQLVSARSLTAASLQAEHAVSHAGALTYVPHEAEFMSLLQGSELSLNDRELEVLDTNGFAIVPRQSFPTFLHGYRTIYMGDLPVYISADSLLHALHSSYDNILKYLETEALQGELARLLSEMLSGVAGLPVNDRVKQAVALHLEVAAGLLREGLSENNLEAAALIQRARSASGTAKVALFGSMREIDFSQFMPRGHYLGILSRYFQSMMWLGRVDLRFFEVKAGGKPALLRDQFDALMAIGLLLTPERLTKWQRIDKAIEVFVGPSDSMTVPQLAELAQSLGGYEAALAVSNDQAAEALISSGFGHPRIASQLGVNTSDSPDSQPLDQSFSLFAQRYTVDSEVLSQVVYDRVTTRPYRMMPQGLDAAFAALGNSQAASVLSDELERYPGYPAALGGMRRLVDSSGPDYWQGSLYGLWSDALRSLSPPADLSDPVTLGLPPLMGTEAWGRRLLNTQLASWSELRHNTILYAKQSYSSGAICDFPDAYVDPYPKFFEAIQRYAELGAVLLAEVLDGTSYEAFAGSSLPGVTSYFENLRTTASMLGDMALRQRNGEPHTAEQLSFINEAVVIKQRGAICDLEEYATGWYADLFYNFKAAYEADPTIADVHTQPTDAEGNRVGNILHVGTGLPRLMVVTVDTCMGPRAYTGLAYSYHEQIMPGFQRLNDQQWSEGFVATGKAKEMPWAQSFIAD